MTAVAEDRRSEREWAIYCAHTNAVLGRAQKIPAWDDIARRMGSPAAAEKHDAEVKAFFAAKSREFRSKGLMRSWEEWQAHSRA